MSDEETRIDACDECCPKEGDFSKKTVYRCKLCDRWFCAKHIEPRLAYIKDWRVIDDSPEMRGLYYTEMQREDGHPDFEYSRRKITQLNIEEKKRNILIKQAFDGMMRKHQTKTLHQKLANQVSSPRKRKNLVVASVALILVVVILFAPIIPTQSTVAKTRARNLQYTSGAYGPFGITPRYVNVTNTDTIAGSFSVKMNMYYNPPLGQTQLKETSTQSSFISAKATRTFNLPSDWYIDGFMYTFSYSVTPATTQVSYNETQTEFKSILNLIESRL